MDFVDFVDIVDIVDFCMVAHSPVLPMLDEVSRLQFGHCLPQLFFGGEGEVAQVGKADERAPGAGLAELARVEGR